MKRIPFAFATNAILIITGMVTLFHICVMVGIVPYNIVWGGRLTDRNAMLVFELSSIIVNMVLAATVAIKAKKVSAKVPGRLVNVVLWVFVILFALNSAGNLAAKATLETLIFTPLTILLSLLCARAAME
jgi:hypothetical protein